MFLKTRKKLGILLLACLLIVGTIPLVFGGALGDINVTQIYDNPDEKWKETALTDSDVVNNDISNIKITYGNHDMESLSMYADKIAADSQTALDNSNSYTVSGSYTQIMKDQYDLGMKQAGQAAIYIKKMVEEDKKGNEEGVKSNDDKAAEYLESYYQHIKFVYQSIQKLHCTRMYSLCINGNNYYCGEQYRKCMGRII